MRQLMLTAKTTLLPANHSLDTKKGLHSNERLDDNQDPVRTFLDQFPIRHYIR